MDRADVLLVVESMWGHTRAVAEAVAAGVGGRCEVVDIRDAPSALAPAVRLLVVGGPTHAFSMSRRRTRRDAVQRGAPDGTATVGIREWLDGLAPSGRVEIATFDTRVARARRLPGSAARSAARSARHRGLGHVLATESFYVEDVDGPLVPGELRRAEAWGAQLASRIPGPSGG